MKIFYRFWLYVFSLISLTLSPNELPFVVLVPSYCNINYYKENLRSILTQNDDNSPDNTGLKVETYLAENNIPASKFHLIKNSSRQGSLANVYNAIHNYCQDKEIVVMVDGDDQLHDINVLNRLNVSISDKNICLLDIATGTLFIITPLDISHVNILTYDIYHFNILFNLYPRLKIF